MNQTRTNWKAIVGFNTIEETKASEIVSTLPKDPRIVYTFIKDEQGGNGYAGKVRNSIIQLCDTKWLCFLDDDDTFTSDYFDRFAEELGKKPDSDAIIFRMTRKEYSPIPSYGMDDIVINYVGISFAVRRKFLIDNGIKFNNSKTEDFEYLNDIKIRGGKIVISKYITYHIRF